MAALGGRELDGLCDDMGREPVSGLSGEGKCPSLGSRARARRGGVSKNRLASSLRTLAVLFFAGAALFGSPATTFGQSNVKPVIPFNIIDSGFPALENQKPFWLDNNRVIFRGVDVSKGRISTPPDLPLPQVTAMGIENGFSVGYYIWDVDRSAVSLYKQGVWALCVEDGIVHYVKFSSTPGGAPTFWRGPLGQEEKLPDSPRPRAYPPISGTESPCFERRFTQAEYAARGIRELRPEFGRLESPRDGKYHDKPVLYFRTGSDRPIELPIERGEFSRSHVFYMGWDDRYLIHEPVYSSERMVSAWYLDRNGSTTPIRIGRADLASVRYVPTRIGLLVRAEPKDGRHPRFRKGFTYLLRDSTLTQVLPYYLESVTISPDGCRGAFVSTRGAVPNDPTSTHFLPYRAWRDWEAKNPGYQTIRVIEFCRAEG
jgi:hypothetical protein